MEFNESVFYGYLVKGNLNGAIQYIKQFDTQADRYQKYISLFEMEQYLTYEVDDCLNEILLIYRKYYREVFYLEMEAEKAVENLRNRFADFFNRGNESIEFRIQGEPAGRFSFQELAGLYFLW